MKMGRRQGMGRIRRCRVDQRAQIWAHPMLHFSPNPRAAPSLPRPSFGCHNSFLCVCLFHSLKNFRIQGLKHMFCKGPPCLTHHPAWPLVPSVCFPSSPPRELQEFLGGKYVCPGLGSSSNPDGWFKSFVLGKSNHSTEGYRGESGKEGSWSQ